MRTRLNISDEIRLQNARNIPGKAIAVDEIEDILDFIIETVENALDDGIEEEQLMIEVIENFDLPEGGELALRRKLKALFIRTYEEVSCYESGRKWVLRMKA